MRGSDAQAVTSSHNQVLCVAWSSTAFILSARGQNQVQRCLKANLGASPDPAMIVLGFGDKLPDGNPRLAVISCYRNIPTA